MVELCLRTSVSSPHHTHNIFASHVVGVDAEPNDQDIDDQRTDHHDVVDSRNWHEVDFPVVVADVQHPEDDGEVRHDNNTGIRWSSLFVADIGSIRAQRQI